jgi:Glycosyltransferase family 87
VSTPGQTAVGGTSTVEPGLVAALKRALPVVLFLVLPVAVVITMFVVGVVTGPLAHDFKNELYPQAKDILAGDNPYPEAIWPPLATVVAMPLTLLPPTSANVAIGLLGLACMAGALWLVGVRDWRVYGVVGVWPPVLGDIRIAHLTPVLCLLAATVWRYRDRPLGAGMGLGLAAGIKFFLWPLGFWLLATGRARATAIAAGVAIGSVLLVAPFAPLDDYLRTLRNVSEDFDQDSYSIFGFLTQLGASEIVARGATFALGAFLLFLMWRGGSFAVAIAAALVLSPIVWFDYYALAAIPLAIARPRLSAIWFLPLITWGLPSSGIATDAVWGVGRVLVVFAVVLTVAARGAPSDPLAGRRSIVRSRVRDTQPSRVGQMERP